jgi:hypothetical protein
MEDFTQEIQATQSNIWYGVKNCLFRMSSEYRAKILMEAEDIASQGRSLKEIVIFFPTCNYERRVLFQEY